MQTIEVADPFDLQRFLVAQEPVFGAVHRELSAGRKLTHWMWFIFPQVAGLGRSTFAQRYAIRSLGEAVAYLAHPVLGPRLTECTRIVMTHSNCSITQIFGSPDDLKFHSSMTLFARVAEPGNLFDVALAQCFGGRPDDATLALLECQA